MKLGCTGVGGIGLDPGIGKMRIPSKRSKKKTLRCSTSLHLRLLHRRKLPLLTQVNTFLRARKQPPHHRLVIFQWLGRHFRVECGRVVLGCEFDDAVPEGVAPELVAEVAVEAEVVEEPVACFKGWMGLYERWKAGDV